MADTLRSSKTLQTVKAGRLRPAPPYRGAAVKVSPVLKNITLNLELLQPADFTSLAAAFTPHTKIAPTVRLMVMGVLPVCMAFKTLTKCNFASFSYHLDTIRASELVQLLRECGTVRGASTRRPPHNLSLYLDNVSPRMQPKDWARVTASLQQDPWQHTHRFGVFVVPGVAAQMLAGHVSVLQFQAALQSMPRRATLEITSLLSPSRTGPRHSVWHGTSKHAYVTREVARDVWLKVLTGQELRAGLSSRLPDYQVAYSVAWGLLQQYLLENVDVLMAALPNLWTLREGAANLEPLRSFLSTQSITHTCYPSLANFQWFLEMLTSALQDAITSTPLGTYEANSVARLQQVHARAQLLIRHQQPMSAFTLKRMNKKALQAMFPGLGAVYGTLQSVVDIRK